MGDEPIDLGGTGDPAHEQQGGWVGGVLDQAVVRFDSEGL